MSCLFMTNYRLLYQTTVEDLLCELEVEIIQAFLKYKIDFYQIKFPNVEISKNNIL